MFSALSAKSLFQEILADDRSFRLFCSVAAGGEAQGGWENGRIAALVPAEERALARKIARHGADEDKHGRIFDALMSKRGLAPVPVPPETDYTMLLERAGIGLAHDRLRRDEPLTVRDIIVYLAHSRVTEQRAADQMGLLQRWFGDDPEIGRAVRMIAHDEDNHLAYTHEELLRLTAAGHGRFVRHTLRACALAEIRVHRDVSLAVMAHMGRILRWSRARSRLLAAGVHARYAYERLGGRRRMVTLRRPDRPDPLGDPAGPAGPAPGPEFA